MRKIVFILTLIFAFFATSGVITQSSSFLSVDAITNFESEISLEKDTTLTVTETIKINFPTPKHGIYRVIPITYSAHGKTIATHFKIVSITDENGQAYKYQVSHLRQSVKIKIGDPDKTITGLKTYKITYQISKILQRFPDYDEIYWNVTGSEWDTVILSAQASISSPYAEITQVECFSGRMNSQEKNCQGTHEKNSAFFFSTAPLGSGKDFTVVIGLSKQNQLIYPTKSQELIGTVFDNFGYALALLPIMTMFFFWFKKGRDKKYAGENIYYVPDDKKEEVKPLFAREHLPTVYSPINGLTPSQVGTIIDEKVDIQDVVAEIVELARLGYLKIRRKETKKLIGKRTDYEFIKLTKDTEDLGNYQQYLLAKLFAGKDDSVLLSSLKNNFYKCLNQFKEKLYTNLAEKGYFDGNPDKVRKKWFGIWGGLFAVGLIGLILANIYTGNFWPMILFFLSMILGLFLAHSMPRKTAWGYSLHRQAEGLAYYLKVGKWRHEINEKNLFLEEVLPLAISLGVVRELANDMQDLGVAPPSYFDGFVAGTLASDLRNFSNSTSSSLISAPAGQWSGASSWSGGSGFGGGGFSGGGFGGGGGGSW